MTIRKMQISQDTTSGHKHTFLYMLEMYLRTNLPKFAIYFNSHINANKAK